jgi:hypothetical protein
VTELDGQLPLFSDSVTWNDMDERTQISDAFEQPDETCAGCCQCDPSVCPPEEHPFSHHDPQPEVIM